MTIAIFYLIGMCFCWAKMLHKLKKKRDEFRWKSDYHEVQIFAIFMGLIWPLWALTVIFMDFFDHKDS